MLLNLMRMKRMREETKRLENRTVPIPLPDKARVDVVGDYRTLDRSEDLGESPFLDRTQGRGKTSEFPTGSARFRSKRNIDL